VHSLRHRDPIGNPMVEAIESIGHATGRCTTAEERSLVALVTDAGSMQHRRTATPNIRQRGSRR